MKKLIINVKRFFYRVFVVAFVFALAFILPLKSYGQGLSPEQKKLFPQNILYYNRDVCNTSESSSSATGVSGDGLVWPFATKDNSQYNRVDQGWDIQDKPGASIYAIASGTLHVYNKDDGNFGNDYPTEQLDHSIGGPSTYIYYGHVHILPGLKDQHVQAGQKIAVANGPGASVQNPQNGSGADPGWLEIGFAVPKTDQPVAHATGDSPSDAGQKMKDLLLKAQPGTDGISGRQVSATPSNRNLYMVGDSVLVGAYYTSGTDFLKRQLEGSGWSTQADANGGRGMEYPGSDPRGSLPGKAKSGLDAIKADSDAIKSSSTVVIELGTNESNSDLSANASANIFQHQMEKAIASVRKANHNANIYWLNISSNVTHPNTPYVKQYNQTISQVAADKNIGVIDAAHAGISLSPDGIHPDTDGYKKLATTITDAIGQFASTNPDASGGAGGCCPTSGGPGLVGNSNEEKIFNFFINQPNGLQPYQAAAIVGNISIESAGTFRPDIAGIGVYSDTPSGAGYGLVQWTPPSTLVDNMNAAHIDGKPSDLDVQLQTIWAELNGKALYDERQVLKDIRNAKDVGDATAAFQGTDQTGPPGFPSYGGFERPADESASLNDRIAAAKAALTKYGGGSSAGAAGLSGQCCPPAASADAGGVKATKPADWTQMYNGANKSKVDSLGHGKIDPKILVIHYTVGNTSGQDLLDFFVNSPAPGCGSGCGIQFNVGKDGKIYQFYPLTNMQETYHVGNANSKAIGIEITGEDVNDIINNKAQFDAVASLSKYLCDYYKIPCSDSKGKMTGDGLSGAQGMLGHDETPDNDHVDPDATKAQASSGGFSYTDSSKHPYMMKLRTTLGFPPTPGKGGSAPGGGDTTSQCVSSDPSGVGNDPVGNGPNRSLALEAVKYDTKANDGKYFYKWGGLHGALSELKDFANNGGGTDCSGFVRYIIWKVYGHDIGGFQTQDVPSMRGIFKEVPASQVAAGDIGWRSDHVEFITENNGGKLHEFGAHDQADDLKGGDASPSDYTKFFRYVGPGAP